MEQNLPRTNRTLITETLIHFRAKIIQVTVISEILNVVMEVTKLRPVGKTQLGQVVYLGRGWGREKGVQE